MFHFQYPSPPPQALFMPPLEEFMEFSKKELDDLTFFSEPDSVLDLGAHISPLNSPCSQYSDNNSSSVFTSFSPNSLSLSDDHYHLQWPEEYETLNNLDFNELNNNLTFNVSSPSSTISCVSSDFSHQSSDYQQEIQEHQEQQDLLEDLLLDVDNSPPPNLLGLQSVTSVQSHVNVEEKGVEIVHLLLACVEHIQEGNSQTSKLILDHLAATIPDAAVGSPLERVSTYIASSLHERINRIALVNTARNNSICSSSDEHLGHAQRVFYQSFPFLKFAHFTANRAILESVKHQPKIHLVDLNIEQGFQWPNFIQVLATSSEEPPSLRITGVGSNALELQTTGNRLAEFAKLVGLESFEYCYVVVNSPEQIISLDLCAQVKDGEALAVNCSMLLHRLLGNQPALERILSMIRSWNPSVIALTEVEADHNTSSFVDRFVEALHFYSAMFDCVESALSRTDSERLCMEKFLFGDEIVNILACEGAERIVRHARSEKWRECLRWSGFEELELSYQALYQAHIFLSLYSSSYTLSRDGQSLILGWHDTPVVSVSTWSCC